MENNYYNLIKENPKKYYYKVGQYIDGLLFYPTATANFYGFVNNQGDFNLMCETPPSLDSIEFTYKISQAVLTFTPMPPINEDRKRGAKFGDPTLLVPKQMKLTIDKSWYSAGQLLDSRDITRNYFSADILNKKLTLWTQSVANISLEKYLWGNIQGKIQEVELSLEGTSLDDVDPTKVFKKVSNILAKYRETIASYNKPELSIYGLLPQDFIVYVTPTFLNLLKQTYLSTAYLLPNVIGQSAEELIMVIEGFKVKSSYNLLNYLKSTKDPNKGSFAFMIACRYSCWKATVNFQASIKVVEDTINDIRSLAEFQGDGGILIPTDPSSNWNDPTTYKTDLITGYYITFKKPS